MIRLDSQKAMSRDQIMRSKLPKSEFLLLLMSWIMYIRCFELSQVYTLSTSSMTARDSADIHNISLSMKKYAYTPMGLHRNIRYFIFIYNREEFPIIAIQVHTHMNSPHMFGRVKLLLHSVYVQRWVKCFLAAKYGWLILTWLVPLCIPASGKQLL